MLRIDAHQHCWQLGRADYGWPTPEIPALYRDFGPAELAPLLRAHGVAGTVLVQVRPAADENDYLLGLADAHDFILGVVGWVDLESPRAPAEIARLARHPKFKGVRPMLQGLADPAWIADPALDPAAAALIEHGLTFDALVRPNHLPHLLRFARRHRRLPVVIDHAAKPAAAAAPAADWRQGMAALAALPNVHCKLSGLATEAGPGWRGAPLQAYLACLLGWFGPERLMWGSDWPVLNEVADYAAWCAATEALLAGRTGVDGIRGANAAAFYRLAVE
ncbi:amidohydrolase family protein [Chitinimonas koreensis]|uniref:amidohydrolase family protein n=1 Tax=Chitinimonas koreensis TaxID=356302 RepID=UPI0003F53BAE|nr:amidohydrolase family protein [Chitinimonas koreensis]